MDARDPQGVKDVWAAGGAYESFIGRWSGLVAAEFLRWLAIPAGKTWLDVGCGTGVLARSVLASCAPAHVRGVDPSPGFIAFAGEKIRDPRIAFAVGSAESLGVATGSCDVVVSGLVLNFVPDAGRAAAEMKRVARPGGVIAAYVWDYADKMEVLRHFWDAATALDPQAAALDEGRRFPLCDPERLRAFFMDHGLRDVDVRPIDIRASFVNFEDYWSPFLAGQGPAPSYVATLDPGDQARLRDAVRGRLTLTPGGRLDMLARAWAVRGRREEAM